jgi:hypothetical protein
LNYAIRRIELHQLDLDNVSPFNVTVKTLPVGAEPPTTIHYPPDDAGVVLGSKIYAAEAPRGVNVAAGSNIWILDLLTRESRVIKTDRGALSSPVWDGNRSLYLTDCAHQSRTGDAIVRFNVDTHAIEEFVGGSNANSDEPNLLDCPLGMISNDLRTVLYVTELRGHRVRRVDLATRTVTTVAGDGESGANDDSIAGGGGLARFNFPGKMAYGGDYLFVADWGNCTIREIDLINQTVTTLAGMPGLCAEHDGDLRQATLTRVMGITYSPQYGLFISSSNFGSIDVPVDGKIKLIH